MRARKEGLSVETRIMDGHTLELEDNTFDVAGSQFGVMLFPDMPRGISEMARVTKPGGRVLMNVYGDPQRSNSSASSWAPSNLSSRRSKAPPWILLPYLSSCRTLRDCAKSWPKPD